jgi:hypothetical protein
VSCSEGNEYAVRVSSLGNDSLVRARHCRDGSSCRNKLSELTGPSWAMCVRLNRLWSPTAGVQLPHLGLTLLHRRIGTLMFGGVGAVAP